jgi:hypothetical protein
MVIKGEVNFNAKDEAVAEVGPSSSEESGDGEDVDD